MLEDLVPILVPIAVFVVLPVGIVWLIISNKKFAAEKRAQIVLAAIEKNPEMDMEVFAQALVPKQKPLRERLVSRIFTCTLIGTALSLLGGLGMVSMIAALLYSIYLDNLRDGFFVMAMVFLPVFALGMGLLLAARQAKKDLAHLED